MMLSSLKRYLSVGGKKKTFPREEQSYLNILAPHIYESLHSLQPLTKPIIFIQTGWLCRKDLLFSAFGSLSFAFALVLLCHALQHDSLDDVLVPPFPYARLPQSLSSCPPRPYASLTTVSYLQCLSLRMRFIRASVLLIRPVKVLSCSKCTSSTVSAVESLDRMASPEPLYAEPPPTPGPLVPRSPMFRPPRQH